MSQGYRPSSGDPSTHSDGGDNGRLPAGVMWLSLAAGALFMVMGARSAKQDFLDMHKLLQLSDYQASPAHWLKVELRQDSAGSGEEYYPNVLYEYFVAGRSIWGWRLSYEELPRPKAYWEMRLRPYKVGDTVTVFVHPENAQEAVAEKKSDGLFRPLVKVGMGVIFGIVGLLLFTVPIFGWLNRWRSSKTT
jgi:hypothetical protein